MQCDTEGAQSEILLVSTLEIIFSETKQRAKLKIAERCGKWKLRNLTQDWEEHPPPHTHTLPHQVQNVHFV